MSINKECRICFESSLDIDDEFLSPCLCNGTSKYIHKKCLERWISTTDNLKARKKCMACNAKYQTIKKFASESYFIKFLNFDEYGDTQESLTNIFYISFLTSQIAFIFHLMFLNNRINFFNDKYLFNMIIVRNKTEYYLINFSFFSFLFLLSSFFVFLKKIFKNVKRKNEYFYFNSITLASQFLFTFHFIFFYLIIGLGGDAYFLYIYLEFCFSLLNPFFLSNIFYCHNQMLKYMNEHLNKDIICNYSKDYVVNNVRNFLKEQNIFVENGENNIIIENNVIINIS